MPKWTEADFKILTVHAIESTGECAEDFRKAFPTMTQGESVIAALLAAMIHRQNVLNKDPDEDAPWKQGDNE